jgi:hypothetical protein
MVHPDYQYTPKLIPGPNARRLRSHHREW